MQPGRGRHHQGLEHDGTPLVKVAEESQRCACARRQQAACAAGASVQALSRSAPKRHPACSPPKKARASTRTSTGAAPSCLGGACLIPRALRVSSCASSRRPLLPWLHLDRSEARARTHRRLPERARHALARTTLARSTKSAPLVAPRTARPTRRTKTSGRRCRRDAVLSSIAATTVVGARRPSKSSRTRRRGGAAGLSATPSVAFIPGRDRRHTSRRVCSGFCACGEKT